MPANPGSSEAKRLGCTCPVLDNNYGKGAVINGETHPEQFYIDPDCSIHRDQRSVEGSGEKLSLIFWDTFLEEHQPK